MVANSWKEFRQMQAMIQSTSVNAGRSRRSFPRLMGRVLPAPGRGRAANRRTIRPQAANDELQAARTTELQAAEAGLQAANDRLQAAKDKLQAANDELQAASHRLPGGRSSEACRRQKLSCRRQSARAAVRELSRTKLPRRSLRGDEKRKKL